MTARRSDYTAADVQAWTDAVAWLRQGERMAREQISKAKEAEDGKIHPDAGSADLPED